MSKDIFLDPVTNDLSIINSIIRLTEVQEETTRQKTSIMLKSFRGECFWDINTLGLPYLKNSNNSVQLLGKDTTDKRFIDVYVREAILSREGIVELLEYESVWDRRTRIMSVSFKAITETGEILTVENLELTA